MNIDTIAIRSCWKDRVSQGLNHYAFLSSGRLAEVVKQYASEKFVIPHWDADLIYPRHHWVFAANQLVSNCFNFAFNIFCQPDTKYSVANPSYGQTSPLKGAFAMQWRISKTFGERIIHGDDLLPHVSSLDGILKLFEGLNAIPLPEFRQRCGFYFMNSLRSHYYDNPLNLLEEAMVWDEENKRSVLRAFNNGKGLVEQLVNNFSLAYGDEMQSPNHYSLRFNKRAQLVALILHGRAQASHGILPPVQDIDEVGPIADYEVPRALRSLGILSYSGYLADYVDNWREIEAGGEMELEIRMATVVACVLLLEHINELRLERHLSKITMCELDYWLWYKGKVAETRPHLVRTSAY